MPKFCPECGKPITENVKFCPECGLNISSFNLISGEKITPEISRLKPAENIQISSGDLVKISGIVNNINKTSTISGFVTTEFDGFVHGRVDTTHKISFRINNIQCWYNKQPFNINNGDYVTALGRQSGELHILALNNRTTNMVYWEKAPNDLLIYAGAGIALIFLALVAFPITFSRDFGIINLSGKILSLIFALISCLGVWYLYKKRQIIEEYKQIVCTAEN
jgi:hypothetical protein